MDWVRSFLMAGLSLISPIIPIFGSIINYITDENTSGLDVIMSFLSSGVEIPISGSFNKTLLTFATSIGFDAAFEMISGKISYSSKKCSRCNGPRISKVFDSIGNPICFDCYIELSKKILIPTMPPFSPQNFYKNNDAIILNSNLLSSYSSDINGISIPIIVPKGEYKSSTIIDNLIILGDISKGKYLLGEIKRGTIHLGDIKQGNINLGDVNQGKLNF